MEDDGFLAHPPAHPVPQLQGPFEESMVESVNDVNDQDAPMDSLARRTILLETPRYERVIAGRWKQKPGERFHPLWKITAQISFGMHLLAEGMAKSEEEVMKILQSHVDDIDGFLERTGEDFDLAQSDIRERLRYLKLPLQHLDVFDRMLEDRAFRMSIVDGNEKIEHIVERTSEAMKDAMKDVQKGLDATKAMKQYLQDLDESWTRTSVEQEAVFIAMMGNVEGWGHAFMNLHLQGNKLGKSLVQLSEIVAEMQKRAGIVSRRTIIRPKSNHSEARRSQRPPSSRQSQMHGPRTSSRPVSKPPGESSKRLPTEPELQPPVRLSARAGLPRQSPSTEKHAIMDTRPAEPQRITSAANLQPPTPASFVTARSSPATPAEENPVISELAATEIATPSLAPKPLQPRSKNVVPMELPAEIPPELLAKAPMSNTNRLSVVAGLDQRPRSSVLGKSFSPSALAALAEVRPRDYQRLSQRPQSPLKPVLVDSEIPAEEKTPQPDYFGSSAATPKADGSGGPATQAYTHTHVASAGGLGILGLDELAEPDPAANRTSLNPRQAFTSHPPDEAIPAQSTTLKTTNPGPAALPTPPTSTTPNQTHTSSHKSQQSSLGEPGPEIDTSEIQNTTDRPMKPFMGINLLDAIARRSVMVSAKSSPNLEQGTTNKVTEDTSDVAGIPFYAELEGNTPQTLAPRTFAIAELEAGPDRLVLPPREPSRPEADSDVLSATITSHGDFFKLHNTEQRQMLDKSLPTPPKTHASMPAPPRLNIDNQPRSSLPPRIAVASRQIPPQHPKARTNILDKLSYTPPESPIHTRSMSEASTNSARLTADHPSRALAPPDECPVPPPPGGRTMVSPDYAAAGAFDGERRSKHSSKASGSSWRRLFSGLQGPPSIGGGASRPGSSRVSSRPESAGRAAAATDLMTAGGKDILWFKGVGKDGVWVK